MDVRFEEAGKSGIGIFNQACKEEKCRQTIIYAKKAKKYLDIIYSLSAQKIVKYLENARKKQSKLIWG